MLTAAISTSPTTTTIPRTSYPGTTTTPPPPPPLPPLISTPPTMYVCPNGTRTTDPKSCPPAAPTAPMACPKGTVLTTSGCVSPTGATTTPTTPPKPTPLPTAEPVRVDTGPTTVPPPLGPLIDGRPTSRRYANCIARFNTTRKVFSIYCPIGATLAPVSLGLADEYFKCLYGNCGGLGAEVSPPVPAGFNPTPVVTTTALPGEGEIVAGEEKDKFFRANNPAMWLLFVGAAAAVGGGSYWVIRRRRAR